MKGIKFLTLLKKFMITTVHNKHTILLKSSSDKRSFSSISLSSLMLIKGVFTFMTSLEVVNMLINYTNF